MSALDCGGHRRFAKADVDSGLLEEWLWGVIEVPSQSGEARALWTAAGTAALGGMALCLSVSQTGVNAGLLVGWRRGVIEGTLPKR